MSLYNESEFITVHNTYNDATAENEVAYMIRNDNQVSFHIAVDDKEAVQGIPLGVTPGILATETGTVIVNLSELKFATL